MVQKFNQTLGTQVFLLLAAESMSASQLTRCIGVNHRAVERVIKRLLKAGYISVVKTVTAENRKPVPFYFVSSVGACLYDFSIWTQGLRMLPFPDPVDPNAVFQGTLGRVDNTTQKRRQMFPAILRAVKARSGTSV